MVALLALQRTQAPIANLILLNPPFDNRDLENRRVLTQILNRPNLKGHMYWHCTPWDLVTNNVIVGAEGRGPTLLAFNPKYVEINWDNPQLMGAGRPLGARRTVTAHGRLHTVPPATTPPNQYQTVLQASYPWIIDYAEQLAWEKN
jgi:hypothetical protein